MKEAEVIFQSKNNKKIYIKCEIAKTLNEKMKGLMFRDFLPESNGMLFVFRFAWHKFFWMKNVKIPLDIIFVDSKLKIIHISQANVEKGICFRNYWSHGFCKYVIETKQGFCKKNNILKGTKIQIN